MVDTGAASEAFRLEEEMPGRNGNVIKRFYFMMHRHQRQHQPQQTQNLGAVLERADGGRTERPYISDTMCVAHSEGAVLSRIYIHCNGRFESHRLSDTR